MSVIPDYRRKLKVWGRVGYEPTEEQGAIHRCRARHMLIAGGERAGKSYCVAKEVLARVPYCELVWLVGPDYEQARPEFEYLLEDLVTLGAIRDLRNDVSRPRTGAWWMRLKSGQEIHTRTSAVVERLAGRAPDGLVMCEAAQQSYLTYLKALGRLSQSRGWLIMVGTFEGSLGWYPDLWRRWQGDNAEGGRSFSLPTWSNRHRFPGGREDEEIKLLERTYPPDLFQERFGAVPCKPYGIVFPEFDFSTHVQRLEVSDKLPVELAIDPGYAGAYAVLAIQHAGPYVHVIDEIYERGKVAQEIIAMCKQRDWWKLVPKVGSGSTGGVIDVAGTQHHGLPSHVEVWAQEAGVALRYNPVSIQDGILALKVLLKDPGTGDPRIFFNSHLRSDRSASGAANGVLAEFGLYRYRDWKEGQPERDTPIDANNHALKALGYWAYDRFGPVGGRAPVGEQKRRKGWVTA